MSSDMWEFIRQASEIVRHNNAQFVDKKVDGLLNATSEVVARSLPNASVNDLRAGAEAAKEALRAISQSHRIERCSPQFVAGRLASMVDVLGYAVAQTVNEGVETIARRQPYASVLSILRSKALRNADIASALDKPEETVCRLLKELRENDLVTSHRRGREAFNSLTPVGRLIVDMGVEATERRPLAGTNVHDLGFALRTRKPLIARGTEMARIVNVS